MSNIPAELRYSEDHEWISTSAPWKIGVSDYAHRRLGDLYLCGTAFRGLTPLSSEEFGTLEIPRSP